MKILQLIYTSCKKGLSTGAGFQTYSMSEGIDDGEKREIERYGLYVPPTNLPTQPSREEIETLFPVAYRFFQLQSGRFGICQSRYTGRDYSGRYGNYFCHAMILEDNYFPVYPIQLYGIPIFRDHLTEEEVERTTTPRPLPGLDSEQLFSTPAITFANTMEFVERTGIEPVKDMVSAAIAYGSTQRGLILTGPQAGIPFLIAALQMAFPLRLAHQLTFTTYSHDPAAINCVISGVPGTGTRYAFTETQRNYENYIFDIENPTPVIEKEYEYTKNVDLGYTISKESLEEFHRFIEGFDIQMIDEGLDGLGYLYRMTRVGVKDLTAEQTLAAVEFANQNAAPQMMEQLGDSLHWLIDELAAGVELETAEIVAKFLFKIARQSSGKKHLETAYKFFFEALDHLVAQDAGTGLEAAGHCFTAIRDENKKYGEEFAQRVLSSGRFKHINRYISETGAGAAAGIYFHQVVGTIISNGYTWDQMRQNEKEFDAFIQHTTAALAGAQENLERALATAAQDDDFFIRWVSFCLTHTSYNREKQPVLLNGYIRAMANKPAGPAYDIRTQLLRQGHIRFIYDEYRVLLHRAPDKPGFFHTYVDTLFKKEKTFTEQCFNDAVNDYLDILEDKQVFRQCERIMGYKEYITTLQVIERVVEGFERGLSLLRPDKTLEKTISTVLEIKRTRKITAAPDITRLLKLGMDSERAQLNPGQVKIPDLIKPGSETYSLRELNARQVSEYFHWSCPNLVRLVKSSRDHEMLYRWYGASQLEKAFTLEYIEELQRIIREDKKTGPGILLNFLEYYLAKLLNDNSYDVVRDQMHKHLVKVLAKLPQNQYEALCSAAGKSRDIRESGAKTGLEKIMADVSGKKKNSVFGRVKRLFGKKEENKPREEKTKKTKNNKNN